MTGSEWIEERGDTTRILRRAFHMGGGGWFNVWQTVDELRWPVMFL